MAWKSVHDVSLCATEACLLLCLSPHHTLSQVYVPISVPCPSSWLLCVGMLWFPLSPTQSFQHGWDQCKERGEECRGSKIAQGLALSTWKLASLYAIESRAEWEQTLNRCLSQSFLINQGSVHQECGSNKETRFSIVWWCGFLTLLKEKLQWF